MTSSTIPAAVGEACTVVRLKEHQCFFEFLASERVGFCEIDVGIIYAILQRRGRRYVAFYGLRAESLVILRLYRAWWGLYRNMFRFLKNAPRASWGSFGLNHVSRKEAGQPTGAWRADIEQGGWDIAA